MVTAIKIFRRLIKQKGNTCVVYVDGQETKIVVKTVWRLVTRT